MEPKSAGPTPAEEVLELAKKEDRRQARQSVINRVALFIVVAATLYAAVVSQIASNKSNQNQQDLKDAQTTRDRESSCTSQILFSAIGALNDRSQFATQQATANIALQKAQLKLFVTTFNKPATEEQSRAAIKEYFGSITAYLEAATKNQNATANSPYPTPQQYGDCLRAAHDPDGPEPSIGPNPTPSPLSTP